MSNKNKDKAGYKHTALGWIPDEWEIKKMKEVARVQGGYAFDSKKFLASGKYQVVKMSNVYNGVLTLERSASFLPSLTIQEENFKLKHNDILLTLTGTIGKRDYGYTYRIKGEENLVLNQRVARIIAVKEYVDPIYLSYEVKTNRVLDQFFFSARGGTGNQANVGTGDVELIKVVRPPLAEQNKIATILSTWDEAITKTQQLIAQLQQRNKGTMQQLLKSQNHWDERKIADIFERVVRKNSSGNTNVITISAQRGFVKQNDFFKKLVASETLDNYFLVRKGEFCYNKSYSNGYDWGATKRLNDFEEAVVTTLYICFRIKNENAYSGNYFEYFFDANILDRGLAKIAHEGGRAHGLLNVTPGDFFSLKIQVPPFKEQIRIFDILSSANTELKLSVQKLAALQQQKKGLLQKLLSGELRVNLNNNKNYINA